jgi:hypothetical protein
LGLPNSGSDWRTNPVSKSLPYLYTAYLVSAAYRSGPGWDTDAEWAFGGLIGGSMVGAVAFVTYELADCDRKGCGGGWATAAIALPLLAGEIWAVQSREPGERQNRMWQRIGGSALGSLTGAGIYFVFPTDWRWSMGFGLLGSIAGSVAGYRLAIIP